MRNIIILSFFPFLFCACVVNMDDSTSVKKSSIDSLEEACRTGNQEVCDLLEQRQKKKEAENRRKLELSGARDKSRK